MNLEQLNIAIRPRRDWEAVDLGLLMARRWWWQMQRVWLLLTLPWLLVSWVVPLDYLWLVSCSLWWLKPVFERPLLMILSQGVFGVKLRTGEVLRAFPRLAVNQILLSLTWRRLSFSRSMDLPVIQLEGLRGSERRDRLNVLHRDDSTPATWLTIIGVHVESFIALACAAVLGMFIPQEVNFDFWSREFWFASRPGSMLIILFAYIAMAVVAPLFVACGFSLYLNRRVKLEGWDIEIAFKQMAQKRGLLTLVMIAALGAISVAPGTVPSAHADAETDRQVIREQILAIKEGPDFHRMETQTVLKNTQKPEQEPDDSAFKGLLELFETLGALLNGLAAMAELLLWAAVLALVILVAVKYRSWLDRFQGVQLLRRRHYQPQTLFGMDVTRESLPDDVGAAALTLWQQHEHRQALALLYRASLAQLLQRGVPLKDGSTEQECLWLVQNLERELQLPGKTLTYFTQLTRSWRQLAYGHRRPSEQQGLELCAQWQQSWFAPAGRQARPDGQTDD